MSDPILLLAGVAVIAVAGLSVVRRRRAKTLDASTPPHTPDSIGTRLASLESAIETLAVEVERVGEGQRFVTKILASRKSTAT